MPATTTRMCTGDIPKVIETLQEAIQTYPGLVDNYVNINVAYLSLGQFEKGLPYAQKGVEIQPDDAIASENLVNDYAALNRLAEAKAEAERARKLGLDDSTGNLIPNISVYFLLGEPKEVQKIMARGRPVAQMGSSWRAP